PYHLTAVRIAKDIADRIKEIANIPDEDIVFFAEPVYRSRNLCPAIYLHIPKNWANEITESLVLNTKRIRLTLARHSPFYNSQQEIASRLKRSKRRWRWVRTVRDWLKVNL